MNKAPISNHYLQACLRGAERQGHSGAALLGRAGIPAEWLNQPAQRITEQQLTRLIKSVWRATRDEFMGLSADRCRQGVFALMAEYSLASETLGAMLRRSARFYSTICPDIVIGMEAADLEEEGLVFFRLQLEVGHDDPDHLLQEFLLLMWQRFSSWLVDQQLPIAITQFNYPAPRHVNEYRAMYPGKLVFERPECGFYLHSRYLSLPLVRTEVELTEFLQQSPAYILHRHSQDDRLQVKIRALLAQHDNTQMLSLEALGRELHLTPRTIARKLKQEGSSVRQIKTALRLEYAIKLLTTEHLSIADVSERMGFSEVAAFCRAFKRWTGRSPTAWSGAGVRPS
ncbi:MAG: AraC-like DNA-binding protein [Motiliproteus sp.]|jgi:AraC-like DNA-binding protein